MAKKVTLSLRSENLNTIYKNASVSKVREENLYDIRFSTGRVKTYVENISNISFNSGEYVAVLITETEEEKIYKIIGRGRRVVELGTIPIINV